MGEYAIELDGVSKEYGSGHTRVLAVSDVSVRVKKGESVLILGPSGSGKTTLLSLIGCILTPSSGRVILHGEEVSGLPGEERALVRRRDIGFVFQGFNLLRSLTVRENIEVALNMVGVKGGQARGRAGEILKEVGLEERMGFYPIDLSGGEKQRVSIARALAKKPRLILADEPTGNLDSTMGRKIGEMLHDLAGAHGATVIVVTHDERLIPMADRIIHLEDGVVSEAGC